MSKNFSEIIAPQFGVNDENAVLESWCYENKEKISKDEIICILESSKATFDVISPDEGYLKILVNKGEKVGVNQLIGVIIFDLEVFDKINFKSKNKTDVKNDDKINITLKAKELANKNNIDYDQINAIGKSLIRAVDIKKLIQSRKNPIVNQLSIKKDSSQKPVLIYGAGKGGATILETIELENKFDVVAFIDDNVKGNFEGKPVFSYDDIDSLYKQNVKRVIIGIANGKMRCELGRKLESIGFKLINAIHPNAYLSKKVKLGKGNHIKSGAIIDRNTIIGNNNIIDNGAIIAHDNLIGDGCHLAPGCKLGSSIEINNYSIMGIGSSVSTNVKIGRGCIVSLNTSVMSDLNDNVLVEGIPGKIIGNTNI
tara:strand:- start:98 stop:1204 length:1107 start_codon:yes stop_codon:yes gene_type:complete